MNLLEKIAFPIYNWDKNKGYDDKLSVFHCRVVCTAIIAISFLDLYDICCLVTGKGIFIFKRFLFDKSIEVYVLGIISLIISILITFPEKWKMAREIDEPRYNLINVFFIFGAICILFIVLQR